MIYVNTENTTFSTLKEFLIFCFRDSKNGFIETYSDPMFVEIQCAPKRNRSFSDLLELSKTYFPNTTPTELAYILCTKIPYLRCLFCTGIRKVVFYIGNSCFEPSSKDGVTFSTSEIYGNREQKGVDSLCINDIINLAEEFKEKQQTLATNAELL